MNISTKISMLCVSFLAACAPPMERMEPWEPSLKEQQSFVLTLRQSTANPAMTNINQAIPFIAIYPDGSQRKIICASLNVGLSPKLFVYLERAGDGWKGPVIGCPSNHVAARLGQNVMVF